ncbi:MAG: porin family protein [Rickettsiales bacterium]|jgi:opacity protein-like surface antigen|nr:porin family protein [Rickettsiales bacterium]
MEFITMFLQKIKAMRLRFAPFSYSLILLFSCFVGFAAKADVQYVVARDGEPEDYQAGAEPLKRFYIEGGWNMHFADAAGGMKADSMDGFSAAVGLRLARSFRVEASYLNLREDYGDIRGDGHWGFANFIFDAKLSPEYQMFKTNPFVPFVGFGVGAGEIEWVGADKTKYSPIAYNLIGGVSVEINRSLALGLAYRFIRWLPNELDAVKNFTPVSHNVSASLRISF